MVRRKKYVAGSVTAEGTKNEGCSAVTAIDLEHNSLTPDVSSVDDSSGVSGTELKPRVRIPPEAPSDRPRLLRENIVNLLIELKSNGYAESTLKRISIRLRHLKQSLVNAYNHYVRFVGLSWVMPIYIREDREIQVPSEENLNLLIGQATLVTARARNNYPRGN